MKKNKVNIKGGNRNLGAQLDMPDNEQPLVYGLFAHCFTCTKDLKSINNINKALTDRRIAILRFDFTGLGESSGDFGNSNISTNIDDLILACKFLDKNYDSPKLLIGHSLGGAAVIQAASLIKSVRAVATIGTPFYPEHLGNILKMTQKDIIDSGRAEVMIAGRKFEIGKKFYDDLEEESMKKKIQELNKALCILHSPYDEIVGIEHAAKIFRLARHPKSFISLDKADHLLMNPHDSLYAGGVIAEWASKYIL
ncbi:alpha/beta hydrolase family protein [Bacteroidota bacterium]